MSSKMLGWRISKNVRLENLRCSVAWLTEGVSTPLPPSWGSHEAGGENDKPATASTISGKRFVRSLPSGYKASLGGHSYARMREEYKAIVDASIVLQIDDPSLPDNWDMINPEPPLGEFKKFERVRIEALNDALRGLPQDRVRYHICWGSWHGPHTTDIPLRDIVDLVLSVDAGA
jgi:5-methyltetrahydropteroyltriglutamate--homocysteine methyltransferase